MQLGSVNKLNWIELSLNILQQKKIFLSIKAYKNDSKLTLSIGPTSLLVSGLETDSYT